MVNIFVSFQDNPDVRLSKTLSNILRHRAKEMHLNINSGKCALNLISYIHTYIHIYSKVSQSHSL